MDDIVEGIVNQDLFSLDKLTDLVNNEIITYLAKIKNYDNATYKQFIEKLTDYIDTIASYNLPLMFQPDELVKITNFVFSSSEITDLIFSVGYKIEVKIRMVGSFNNETLYDKILDSIVDTLSVSNKVPSKNNGGTDKFLESCLIPDDIKKSLVINSEVLSNILKCNNWLVTVILINMFYIPTIISSK